MVAIKTELEESQVPDRSEYGTHILQSILPILFQLRILEEANRRMFEEYIPLTTSRRAFMDKYAVEIDPEKVEREKLGHKGPQPKPDPNVNVPIHPKEGTLPYEKEPDDAKKISK